jgi:outer membrane protein assembly factor BamE (lipoprotein component of BamABCDE complex)
MIFFSCSHTVSLDIDLEKWSNDYEGCHGYRLQVYEQVVDQKENLLGLSTQEIIKTLGNPNINELYQRNQKFFVYRISPADVCQIPKDNNSIFLIFRFNAMGLASEIYLNDEASPTN